MDLTVGGGGKNLMREAPVGDGGVGEERRWEGREVKGSEGEQGNWSLEREEGLG